MTSLNDGDEQARLALQILGHFNAQGEVLTDTRHVLHYFYGDGERLPPLRAELEGMGYSVRPTTGSPGLVAEINAITDEAWAAVTTRTMCALAARFSAEYDGWEAAMVRQGPIGRRANWLSRLLGKRS
jgi:hypothetical protein